MAQNVLDLAALREAGPVAEAPVEQVINSRALGVLSDKRLLGTATYEPLHSPLLEKPQNRDDLVEQGMPKHTLSLAQLHSGGYGVVA